MSKSEVPPSLPIGGFPAFVSGNPTIFPSTFRGVRGGSTSNEPFGAFGVPWRQKLQTCPHFSGIWGSFLEGTPPKWCCFLRLAFGGPQMAVFLLVSLYIPAKRGRTPRLEPPIWSLQVVDVATIKPEHVAKPPEALRTSIFLAK